MNKKFKYYLEYQLLRGSEMKWADHRRITLEISRFYGIPESKGIAEASILPDKEPDYYLHYGRKRIYRRRVPHHETIAVETAFNYLKQARKRFISGMSFAEHLGRALHYLQDYPVDPTENIWIFKYRSDRAHEEREEVLKSIPIDFRAVEEAKKLICHPHEFKHSLQHKTGKDSRRNYESLLLSYLSCDKACF